MNNPAFDVLIFAAGAANNTLGYFLLECEFKFTKRSW